MKAHKGGFAHVAVLGVGLLLAGVIGYSIYNSINSQANLKDQSAEAASAIAPDPNKVVITSPVVGDTLVWGKKYTITWTGQEKGVDKYEVFIVGNDGGYYLGREVGTVKSSARSFTFTLAKEAPQVLADKHISYYSVKDGPNYRIQLGGSYEQIPLTPLQNGQFYPGGEPNPTYRLKGTPIARSGAFNISATAPAKPVVTSAPTIPCLNGTGPLQTGQTRCASTATQAPTVSNITTTNVSISNPPTNTTQTLGPVNTASNNPYGNPPSGFVAPSNTNNSVTPNTSSVPAPCIDVNVAGPLATGQVYCTTGASSLATQNQITGNASVTLPVPSVTAPTAGQKLIVGKIYTVKWTGFDSGVAQYPIYLIKNSGNNVQTIKTLGTGQTTTKTFSFTVPSVGAGTDYRIQLGTVAKSAMFSIVVPSITITKPTVGEQIGLGRTYRITWTEKNIPDISVSLEYTTPFNFGFGGRVVSVPVTCSGGHKLIAGTNTGYCDWLAPTTLSSGNT